MHIVCPNCAASYQVGASAIGPAGRAVRCVRCRTVWHQRPEAEPPSVSAPVREEVTDATVAAFRSELGGDAGTQPAVAPAPPGPAEQAAAAAPPSSENDSADTAPLSGTTSMDAPPEPPVADDAGQPTAEISIPADAAPPVAPTSPDATPQVEQAGPGDIESIASRRRRRGSARRRMPARAGRIPALIFILVVVVAALIGWRGSIVRHAPQMASLYSAIGLTVNLRGLTFTDVKVTRDTHDGVPVLMVEGNIVSTASVPVEVPRLRFAMRNEAGGEVYAWTTIASREVLGPGETLPFRSRLASPPGEGHDVTVRFFNRLDSLAGLR
jgi:predicted Zn finger-like uncharacterized protein